MSMMLFSLVTSLKNFTQQFLKQFGYKIVRVYDAENGELKNLPHTLDYHAYYHGVDFLCPGDSLLGSWILTGQTWDPKLVEMIQRCSQGRQDFTICEVGSNIGASIVPVMVQFPNYHFILVEASPHFVKYLRHNTSFLAGENLVIHHVLLSDEKTGCATLVENSTTGGRTRQGPYGVNREYHLKTITLDELVGDHQIDFLKIDTDGFELPILRGATKLIKRYRPYLWVEFTPDFLREGGEEPEQFLEWLLSFGYERLEVYDNLGTPLGELSIQETLQIAESKPNKAGYVDILFIPS
jgi:FkbM family methyltransferase